MERAIHGAVASLLADARAPQRVSTPPSSGLAAAPLGQAQRAASQIGASSPAPAKKNRYDSSSSAPVKVHPTHPNPTPFFPLSFFELFFSGLSEWGKKLGLGLGFVLCDLFSLPFISFFSFIRMEKMGLGLGFDPSSFFFPFSLFRICV